MHKRNSMTKRIVKIVLTTLLILVGIVILFSKKEKQESYAIRSYSEIMNSGYINAVTEYNSISYYMNNDTIEGFDYELLHAFGKAKGIAVRVSPEMSYEKRFEGILKGKYDLLAAGTLVNKLSKDSLLFTHTLLLSKQVLIQRKPENGNDSLLLKNVLNLRGKTIHTIKNSPATQRLHHLMNEIADTIYIEEIEQYGPEQLVAMVAAGEIDYAVCSDNIAQKAQKEYNNINISTDISFTQFYAWAVNKKSGELADSLNSWMKTYTHTKEYKKLYSKYFKQTLK